MHDQPAQGCAALAGGAHGGEGDAAQGQVQVGRGGDDGGVVAAELQQRTAEPGGDPGPDLAAHGGRARGGQQRHLGVIDQGFADLAAADDQFRQVGGGVAEAGAGALEQALHGHGGKGGLLGGLPDHGVAADQGQRRVPGPDGDREVEGGDDAHHAQGAPGFHHPVLGPLGGDGQAEQLARQADGVVADVDHFLHLAEALGGDLAGLQGDQAAEVGLGGAQFFAQQSDQLAPARRGDLAPGQIGGVGAVDRGVGLVRRRLPHAADLAAGDGRGGDQGVRTRVVGDDPEALQDLGGLIGGGRDGDDFIHLETPKSNLRLVPGLVPGTHTRRTGQLESRPPVRIAFRSRPMGPRHKAWDKG